MKIEWITLLLPISMESVRREEQRIYSLLVLQAWTQKDSYLLQRKSVIPKPIVFLRWS
jgi:hypothetical protein